MSNLAITGLMSGLDVDSIINQLVDVQRRPLDILETKKSKYSANMAALQDLNAHMLNVSNAVSSLTSTDTFRTKTVKSSNTDLLDARVEVSSSPGSHTIEIQSLAKAQSFAGSTFTADDEALSISGQFMMDGELITIGEDDTLSDVATEINSKVNSASANVLRVNDNEYRLVITRSAPGSDSLTLSEIGADTVLQDLGIVTGTTSIANAVTNGAQSGQFSADDVELSNMPGLNSVPSGTVTLNDGGGDVSVAIDFATQSLQDIATAINDAAGAAASNITASVIEEDLDGETVYRLEVTGDADIVFTDDNSILQTLNVLSPDLADEVRPGSDAVAVINGITITRQSNIINDVISGVTLLLNDEEVGETVTLTIGENPDAVAGALSSFVEMYNTAHGFIQEQTAYDPETQEKGVLLGDSAVRSVESNMYSMLGTRVGNILLRDLSELNDGDGVSTGTIKITDRSGASADIDLSSATSVQDVIALINGNSDISVEVSSNSSGSGLVFTDTSAGGVTFKISDVGTGTFAADMGIATSAHSNRISSSSLTDSGSMSLVDIGISSDKDGNITLDQGKLNQAMTESTKAVERLFTAAGAGVGQVAKTKLDFITKSTGGTISNRTKGIQNVMDDIDDRVEVGEKRLLNYEVRLQKQYATLESTLSRLQTQGDYFTQQIDSFNRSMDNSR